MNVFVLNINEDILKKVCNQAVLENIDFYSRKKYRSVSLILQNIFLCVQNKHIHTGLEILQSESMMTGCSFLGALSL